MERPELSRDSLEFVATKKNLVRLPMPHELLSPNAVSTGFTASSTA